MSSVKIDDESAQNGLQINPTSQPAFDQSSNPIEVFFDEIDGFEWNEEFEKILASLARTGLPPPSSPPWSTILKAMLYSLKITVQNYFKLGSASLFDTREEPAGGWLWTSEDLQKSIDRVYLALKDFSDRQPNTSESHPIEPSDQVHSIQSAPFTIQRLTELMFPQSAPPGIHPHYATLPKYLRAIQRVLSVSSPVISYAVNTFMLSHPHDFIPSHSSTSSHSSSSYLNGINPLTITTSTSRPRRHSSSTPITPILSPIPWLVNSERHDSLSPERAPSDGRRSRHTSPLLLNSGSDERPITPPLMGASPPNFTTTPPMILPSNSSPRAANFIISPTPINRTSPCINLPHEEILTSRTAQNDPDADQSIYSSETPMSSISDTNMTNDVRNETQSPQNYPKIILNKSEDLTMDEAT